MNHNKLNFLVYHVYITFFVFKDFIFLFFPFLIYLLKIIPLQAHTIIHYSNHLDILGLLLGSLLDRNMAILLLLLFFYIILYYEHIQAHNEYCLLLFMTSLILYHYSLLCRNSLMYQNNILFLMGFKTLLVLALIFIQVL